MDIKHLQYFVSIVDHGGYSPAARSLFITQPTLSQTIKKLESELHTPLFIQQTNGISLTDAGQLLYEDAKKIILQLEETVQKIQRLNRPQKETIRIGLPTLFAIKLMPVFSRFMMSHPTVHLTMIQGGSRELQTALVNGEIDLGVLSFPKIETDIYLEPFQKEFLGYHASIVVPKGHPFEQASSLTFEHLKNERFSTLSRNFMLGKLLHTRSRDFGFEPHIVYTDDNWEVLLASLTTFNSICIMAHEYKEFYSDASLTWIPLDDKKSFFPIGVAYLPNQTYSQNTIELIELLRDL